MFQKEKLCVVIPVHKPQLDDKEEISLRACKKHLSTYDCFLIYPRGMEVKNYLNIFCSLKLQPVDPKWLMSVEQYNKMKLSLSFYDMFSLYKFLLTYELDSYIFRGDFESSNIFSYDFIGAPFFQGYLQASSDAVFIKGCNSGFSLRNIQSCRKILQGMHRYKPYWLIYKYFFSRLPKVTYHLNRLLKYRFDLYLTGKLSFYFSQDHHFNEDLVWTRVVPQMFTSFKVADYRNALRFSFEHNPERLLELNEGQLPIGCHAWHKYQNFWRQFIE
jgi:hypothetical protein